MRNPSNFSCTRSRAAADGGNREVLRDKGRSEPPQFAGMVAAKTLLRKTRIGHGLDFECPGEFRSDSRGYFVRCCFELTND